MKIGGDQLPCGERRSISSGGPDTFGHGSSTLTIKKCKLEIRSCRDTEQADKTLSSQQFLNAGFHVRERKGYLTSETNSYGILHQNAELRELLSCSIIRPYLYCG